MPPSPARPSTPDFLGNPALAQIVSDALHDAAEDRDKLATEIGQQRVMAPLVQIIRRAAVQTAAYAKDDEGSQ